MTDPGGPAQPLFAVGLALVVMSCMLLAVRVDGSFLVVVRVLQVALALIGAVILGAAAGWPFRRR